jgi:hypothetical protein
MELKDSFFINVLKYFDSLLLREKYTLRRLNYSPIVDDNYEVYYESLSNSKVGVAFRLALYYETTRTPITVVFSRPKSPVLGIIGVEFDGFYEWCKSRKIFSLEDVFKKYKEDSFLKQQITEDNLGNSLRRSADFIQQHLMPVIRGEKWIDEIETKP